MVKQNFKFELKSHFGKGEKKVRIMIKDMEVYNHFEY
jgi:hypothetical protein